MKNKLLKIFYLYLAITVLTGFRTNIAFKKMQQSKLVFTTIAQSIFTGNCSGIVGIQTQSASGSPQNVVSNLTVNLATTGTMQFYSDSSCTTNVSAITVTSGSSVSHFYFILTANGTETMTISAAGYSSASQTATSSTNPFVWIGAGGNTNWNNGANWSGGLSPSAANHYAIFDSTCVSNCSPTINISLSIGGIRINSGYSGTVTLGAGNTLNLGENGWVQAAGSFLGGNSNITFNGNSKVTAGSFTSTSAILELKKDMSISGATFNHNSGKVILSGTAYPTRYYFNGFTFNNLDIVEGAWGNVDLLAGTFTVNGSLKLESFVGCVNQCTLDNGTINAKGNVSIVGSGFFGAATIKINGSSNQTLDASLSDSTGRLPTLEIASTGGTVSFVGSIGINKNYTYTSGTVNAGTSTLNFNGSDQNIVAGTVSYYNVSMQNNNWQQKDLMTSAMTVTNDLYLSTMAGCGGWCQLSNGTINVGRNVTVANGGYVGNAVINMTGSGNGIYSVAAATNIPTGSVTINKSVSTATVTLASNMPLTALSQALTITSGVLDLSGFTLSVTSTLTIASAGSLLCNGGSYSVGSLANSGTIDCASYPFNWTGGGVNSNWSTGANWSGGIAPNLTQVAIFKDAYCSPNCNVNLATDPNVKGVRLLSGYTGTISQGAGITVTIGASGWGQAGGTFNGASSTILISASLNLTGGTFVSTSGTLSLQNNFIQTGTSVFTANSGTVKTTSISTITTVSAIFNHLYLDSSYTTVTINGTVNVNGNFTYGTSSCCGMTMIAGSAPAEINVYGNASVNLPNGYGGSGSVKVKIVGSGTQTITGAFGGGFPNLVIASSGNVNFSGYFATNSFTHSSGTVSEGTSTVQVNGGTITTNGMNFNHLIIDSFNPVVNGTLTVNGNFTFGTSSANSVYLNVGTAPGVVEVKGNVTTGSYNGYGGGNSTIRLIGTGNQTVTGNSGFLPNFEIANSGGVVTFVGSPRFNRSYNFISAGSLVTTGSTVIFKPDDYGTVSIIPGSSSYGSVSFDSKSTFNLTGTLFVTGNLNLNSVISGGGAINSGTIDLQGNLTSSNYGLAGTANINFSGATNSTITFGASALKPTGTITVNKASVSNTVTLTGNTSFNGTNQDLVITSGTLDMAGYNLTINRNITNNDVLKRGNNPSCGVVSYSGSYSGNAAICP